MTTIDKNPYFNYAKSFLELVSEGKKLPYGQASPCRNITEPESDSPIALLLSPHPDDECIIGGLPLRLARENGFRIVNLALTLGSNSERRKERLKEVREACSWIGFEFILFMSKGLNKIHTKTREKDPLLWQSMVEELKRIISDLNPSVIFFPNARDWNLTHLGVRALALDSLSEMKEISPTLIETEYWGQIPEPNLLVESSLQDVSDLLTALSHHQGELERNPFHLRFPAWLQDNVRRGAELVGGQGKEAPEFGFATLYRVSRMHNGSISASWPKGRFLPCDDFRKQDLFEN